MHAVRHDWRLRLNLRIPIQDVILVFIVTGLALTPWPWLALLGAAAWLIGIAFLVDARTPAQEAPASPPASGSTGGES